MGYINLLEIIYPIGSIYLSTVDTSPATLIGGSWESVQLNVGNPVVDFGKIDNFKTMQIGDLVFYNIFANTLSATAWQEKTLSSNMIPSSGTQSNAGSGIIYGQDSRYCAWTYVTPEGKLQYANKNSGSIPQWGYGVGFYQSAEPCAEVDTLGIYAWKRLA